MDNCQIAIYGGFAPNSEAAEVLSKILGEQTVQTGSVSMGKDKSKSLQMTGKPLMSPNELKIMPKDTFIVTRTGVKPMKTKLKLFFEWGIELNESYRMPEARVRKVAYVNRQSVEELIKEKYGSLMPRKKSVPLTEEQKKQIEAEKQAAEAGKKAPAAEEEKEKTDMTEIIGKVKQTKT